MSRSIRLAAVGAVAAALVALLGPTGVGAQDATEPPSTTPVPILLYHHIATAPKRVASPALYVPSALFKQQMAALAKAGYEAVTLDDVVTAWTTPGGSLPTKPVVVTFDDGFTNQFTGALPVMKARGWPGVLNLIVNSIYQPRITTAQVKAMLRAGWELDAHTVTHPDLSKITDPVRLTREIVGGRTALQERYGAPVDFIAYPYGHVSQQAAQIVIQDAGFLGGMTTAAGIATPSTDRARLPRIIVSPKTTPAALVTKLSKLRK